MQDIVTGKLYLVATPIGNLSDISARAVQTLHDADFIASEDTRVTRKLLEHYKIKKPLVSYHSHNSDESGTKILERLQNGETCALVSDAGTPAISDPGKDLVTLCAKADIEVLCIPGACAAISALSLSGLESKRFTFEGFLPETKKKRKKHLDDVKTESRTMIFYEAPHKLRRTLDDMFESFGNRRISISRELTKIFEETLRMDLSEAIKHFEENAPRGEFTIVIEGHSEVPDDSLIFDNAIGVATQLIESGLSVKDAVKQAAGETGCSKNALYRAVTKS